MDRSEVIEDAKAALAERVEKAVNELYDHLDRYGASKRTAYLIEALIEAKIQQALANHAPPSA
jgi:hypothetical protein